MTKAKHSFPAEELRAFVGPKAKYYLSAWRATVNEKRTTFNWAAFFGTAAWLLYRKMYRLAALCLGVIFCVSIVEDIASASVPAAVWGLTTGIIVGYYGNRWYFHHALRAVGQLRSSGLRALAKRGGTSPVAVLVLFILVLVALLLGYLAESRRG